MLYFGSFILKPPPCVISSYLPKVLCLCQCSKTLQLFCTRSDQAKRGVTPPPFRGSQPHRGQAQAWTAVTYSVHAVNIRKFNMFKV